MKFRFMTPLPLDIRTRERKLQLEGTTPIHVRQLFSAHKDHIDILEKWIMGTQGLMTALPVKEGIIISLKMMNFTKLNNNNIN